MRSIKNKKKNEKNSTTKKRYSNSEEVEHCCDKKYQIRKLFSTNRKRLFVINDRGGVVHDVGSSILGEL